MNEREQLYEDIQRAMKDLEKYPLNMRGEEWSLSKIMSFHRDLELIFDDIRDWVNYKKDSSPDHVIGDNDVMTWEEWRKFKVIERFGHLIKIGKEK